MTDEPDFLITGFEWSMRIVSEEANVKIGQAPATLRSVSFAEDWRNLALLFALFLDIPAAPLANMKLPASKVADHASAAEVRLLRAMLGLESVERLDGPFVTRRIDDIIDAITADVVGYEARLCLGVRVGAGSGLSEAIRSASRDDIEITDEAQQVLFIVDDLSGQPELVAVKTAGDVNLRYVLHGRALTYRLAPYRQPGTPILDLMGRGRALPSRA
jgi:hypothetical protein